MWMIITGKSVSMAKTIRENLEELEYDILSPYAAKSAESKDDYGKRSPVISDRYIKGTETEFFIPNLFAD